MEDEIERVHREENFRDYMGQAIWHITTIQHLMTDKPNEMPQYVELVHPNLKKSKGKQLTKAEIIDHVLEKLR